MPHFVAVGHILSNSSMIATVPERYAMACVEPFGLRYVAHPLALQLRNLQSLVEIGVDKNTTVVFPAPLMSTIGELGSFLAREATAAAPHAGATVPRGAPVTLPVQEVPVNGESSVSRP